MEVGKYYRLIHIQVYKYLNSDRIFSEIWNPQSSSLFPGDALPAGKMQLNWIQVRWQTWPLQNCPLCFKKTFSQCFIQVIVHLHLLLSAVTPSITKHVHAITLPSQIMSSSFTHSNSSLHVFLVLIVFVSFLFVLQTGNLVTFIYLWPTLWIYFGEGFCWFVTLTQIHLSPAGSWYWFSSLQTLLLNELTCSHGTLFVQLFDLLKFSKQMVVTFLLAEQLLTCYQNSSAEGPQCFIRAAEHPPGMIAVVPGGGHCVHLVLLRLLLTFTELCWMPRVRTRCWFTASVGSQYKDRMSLQYNTF